MDDRLIARFHRIVEAVRSSDEPLSCWSTLLEITGQASNQAVAGLDVRADIVSLTEQTDRVLRANRLPPEVTFFWFGLCDLLVNGHEIKGYYLSGYSGTDPDGDSNSLVYSPESRWLRSNVLESIKDALKRIERTARDAGKELPEDYQALDYALMFGAAALLTKFVMVPLNTRSLPVYVGFDSGDWALVNTPAPGQNEEWPIVPAVTVDESSS